MPVDRCACLDLPLDELKQIAAAYRLTLEDLKAKTQCCSGCGMCEPYVELMLRTGKTVFEPIPPHEAERLHNNDSV